jgi:hypothetical protein
MKVIKKGVTGPEVEQWQYFLIGDEYPCNTDGVFGDVTHNASIQFQKDYGLVADGIVGPGTYKKAMELGFEYLEGEVEKFVSPKTEAPDAQSEDWPAVPNFRSLSQPDTEKLFGKIEFVASSSGKVEITNGWDKDNIVEIYIPQLNKIGQKWGHNEGRILFHKDGAQQMIDLWQAWDDAGLLKKVINWSGSFYPRFVRGYTDRLSNHSYGTAFDINVSQNGLGKRPALAGELGSVRELVPLANKFGFFWGGHYLKRKDGMHFEVAKIITPNV